MKRGVFFLSILLLLVVACDRPKDAFPAPLSPLQITACETADHAGTCETRLAEVGIVTSEDCCEALGKCC